MASAERAGREDKYLFQKQKLFIGKKQRGGTVHIGKLGSHLVCQVKWRAKVKRKKNTGINPGS